MAEDQDLREKNTAMVQAVQHWKMTAAQRENENLELKKEVNELRFKLARLRNAETARAKKLNNDVQSASEEALSQLVQASSTVARMLQHVKSYIQDREDIETSLPKWSTFANSPSTEKVHRVRPLIGGQHIQPVVALNRNDPVPVPDQIRMSIPVRAVPMRMLQVFVPLTRIDARRNAEHPAAEHPEAEHSAAEHPDAENEEENTPAETTDESASNDGSEEMEEPLEEQDEYEDEESQRLEVVTEEVELEESAQRRDDPVEGPSWLLDRQTDNPMIASRRSVSEPDATTVNGSASSPGPSRHNPQPDGTRAAAREFTPTVRRRRRASPPPDSPRSPHASPRAAHPAHPARRLSKDGRILKVMVAKLRLDDERGSGDATPPKRANLNSAPKQQNTCNAAQVNRQNHTEFQPTRAEMPSNRQSPAEVQPRRPSHAQMQSKRAILAETQQKPQKIFQRRSILSPMRQASSPTNRQSTDGSPICPVRDLTPSHRLMRFDAPSPNGSTDSRVIVLESVSNPPEPCYSGVHRSRTLSRENPVSHDNHSNHQTPTTSNHENRRACDNNAHRNQNTLSFNHEDFNYVDNSRHSRVNRSRPVSRNDNHVSRNDHHVSRNDNHISRNDSHVSRSDDIYVSRNDNRVSRNDSHVSRNDSHVSRNDDNVDSDSSNSDAIIDRPTRRVRKRVVYKEKPLNRKMRR